MQSSSFTGKIVSWVRSHPGAIAFLTLVAVLFYYINSNAFMINDDFLYALAQECTGFKEIALPSWMPVESISMPTARIADYPVDSWGTLLKGWLVSPWSDNIRLGNFMVRLFLFLGSGKAVFNVANTLIGVVVLILLTRYAFKKTNTLTLGLALAAFVLFIPGLEGTCLWTAGACNYLWGALLMVAFLLVIRRIQTHDAVSRRTKAACYLLALLVGFQHEGLSAPMMVALISLFLINRGQRKFWASVILCHGFTESLCFFSPGNFNRLSKAGGSSMFNEQLLVGFLECVAVPLFIIILLAVIYRRSITKEFIREHCALLVFTAVSLALFSFTVHGATWGIAGPAFYLCMGLVLCTLLLIGNLSKGWQLSICLPGAALALGLMSAFAWVITRDAGLERQIISALRNNEKVVDNTSLAGTHVAPSWLLTELRPVLHNTWKWPMVQTAHHLEAYQGQPYLIIGHISRHASGWDNLPREHVEAPCMASTGNLACIKLPHGTMLAGIGKVSGKRGHCETEFHTPRVHSLMNLLHDNIVSWVKNAPICTFCEHYEENGDFYVSLQAPQGCSIGKAVIRLNRDGADKAEKWEVSLSGAQNL